MIIARNVRVSAFTSRLTSGEFLGSPPYLESFYEYQTEQSRFPRHESMTSRFKVHIAGTTDMRRHSRKWKYRSRPPQKPQFRADRKVQRKWVKWRASAPNKGRGIYEVANV